MVPPARTVAAPIRAATTPPLVERCVRALGAGLPLGGWSYRPGPTSQPQVDGHLDLRLADRRVRFAIAARWRLGPDHLGPLQQLARRLAKADEHLLVCTDRVPPAVADELRALRIAYLDAGGNAWLDVDGLFVWVAGRAPAAPVRHRTRLRGTDLRLLGAFLCAGKDTSWNQRQW